jgi:hypothetical protein
LAGVKISVLDRAGQTLPVLMTTAGPLFTEGVMPDAATPGMATVIVQPPQGPSISQPVTIGRTTPGLYSDHGIAVPSGFALDSKGNVFPLATCLNQSCFTTHLPVSSTPGGFDFVLYSTGFRARPGLVRMRIGKHTLNDVKIHQHPNIAGVDELHFHIPQDFPCACFRPSWRKRRMEIPTTSGSIWSSAREGLRRRAGESVLGSPSGNLVGQYSLVSSSPD